MTMGGRRSSNATSHPLRFIFFGQHMFLQRTTRCLARSLRCQCSSPYIQPTAPEGGVSGGSELPGRLRTKADDGTHRLDSMNQYQRAGDHLCN